MFDLPAVHGNFDDARNDRDSIISAVFPCAVASPIPFMAMVMRSDFWYVSVVDSAPKITGRGNGKRECQQSEENNVTCCPRFRVLYVPRHARRTRSPQSLCLSRAA